MLYLLQYLYSMCVYKISGLLFTILFEDKLAWNISNLSSPEVNGKLFFINNKALLFFFLKNGHCFREYAGQFPRLNYHNFSQWVHCPLGVYIYALRHIYSLVFHAIWMILCRCNISLKTGKNAQNLSPVLEIILFKVHAILWHSDTTSCVADTLLLTITDLVNSVNSSGCRRIICYNSFQ